MADHPSSPAVSAAASDRRIAAAIGLLLAAIYLATGAFHFFAVDEISSFALTRSLVGHRAADTDILAWVDPLMGQFSVTATGLDGHVYSIKDLAPSILMVPFAALGYVLHISPVRLVYLLPLLVTALTGAILYLVIRWLGYPRRSAWLGSLVFGLASMAFPYARVIFTQPEAALGLLIALWGALQVRADGRLAAALLGGFGMGLAGLSAAPVWVTAPVFLIAMTLIRLPSGAIRLARPLNQLIRPVLAWGMGAGLLLACQAIYNLSRFGSPISTGHQAIGAALDVSYMGLASWAQLISTPRGLLWFAPFVILIPFSLPIGRRTGRLGLQAMCLAISLLVLLVYSAFFNWSAGLAFGPRFLAAVMPELVLAALPLLDSFLDGMALWPRLLTGAVLLISFLTQLGGSLLDYSRAESHVYELLARFTPPKSFFAWSPEFFSPANLIQVHLLTALQHGWWDVLWMSRGSPDWPLLAVLLALIVLAVSGLVSALRGEQPRLGRFLPLGQAVLTLGLIAWTFGTYPRTQGYSRAVAEPSPDLDAALAKLDQAALPGDGVIVTLFLSDNLVWLENPVLSPPDIGLPLEAPLRPATRQLLDHLPGWYDRVWVVSKDTTPGDPHNGAEAWLAGRAFAGTEIDSGDYRLAPFTFGFGSMTLKAVDDSFGGGAIRLSGFAAGPDQAARPRWLNVWLRWQAARPPDRSETVFVHLIGPQGNLVAQHDGLPQAGYAPTPTWQPGAPVDDRHSLLLPADLPPGDYSLSVGLYDSASGQPMSPDGSSAQSIVLLHLHVGPDGLSIP